MKIKARQKLIPAIAMLLVSAVVLGSASYAWFTMTKEVSATNMNVTAKAPTNLLISNQENAGYDVVADAADKAKFEIKPVSSLDGVKLFKVEKNVGDAGNMKDVADIEAITTETDYYKDFTFYLKNNGDKAVDVSVKSIDVKLNLGTKDMTTAVRCAILNEDGTAKILAGSKNLFAKTGYAYFDGQGPLVDTASKGTPITDGTEINNTNAVFQVAGGGAPTKITIRVWFEGQDKACINEKATSDCNLAVTFTGVEVTV